MKTIPERSVDATLLGKRLCKMEMGEELTYAELSELVPGRRLDGKDRSVLYSAMRYAKAQSGVVVKAIRGVGIKRLADEDIVTLGDYGYQRIRKISKRTTSDILCANYAVLSNEDKLKHNTAISTLGVIQQFTTKKAQESISVAVKQQEARIDFSQTLALFKK